MRSMNGLLNFQHCQYSGTSRRPSLILTKSRAAASPGTCPSQNRRNAPRMLTSLESRVLVVHPPTWLLDWASRSMALRSSAIPRPCGGTADPTGALCDPASNRNLVRCASCSCSRNYESILGDTLFTCSGTTHCVRRRRQRLCTVSSRVGRLGAAASACRLELRVSTSQTPDRHGSPVLGAGAPMPAA
jgi:hypothetical protein